MPHFRPIFALFALLLAVAPARAQQSAAAPQQQALVVTAANRTAAAEAERGEARRTSEARPGDVVRYRLAFRNVAGRPVRGVKLDNPVAAGMTFVAGSTRASRDDVVTEYSVDGGRTYAAQPMVEVTENGRRVRRPAAPETYTHVRWTVQGWVSPDATVTAEFDARLGNRPAAGAAGR